MLAESQAKQGHREMHGIATLGAAPMFAEKQAKCKQIAREKPQRTPRSWDIFLVRKVTPEIRDGALRPLLYRCGLLFEAFHSWKGFPTQVGFEDELT